ncbi:MAG: carboxylating nicotinate-nucleotide diphosphorylase [Prevotellaceae bacterium]|jgi:nicotinate-nucleotide pyrophosphorylase (carboxylating)|nr:carboxylating nicotinate-nucleotide diphosphorylase [Prevotellaceae bacterium]
MKYQNFIDDLISLLIKEDIGDGDHSSLSTIPFDARGRMKLLVKQDGIIAGIEIAKQIFNRIDSDIKIIEQLLHDGDKIKFGDIAFYVEGRIQSLLQSERLVLNVMQHMSGIATTTADYLKCLEGLKTKILDTRKTTPGMRVLDKMAVKTGGGENHRMGLFDMIMLKDNHIDFAGGIENAILKAQNYLKEKHRLLKIEIEVRSIADIKKVMQIGGVDIIMLDNFDIATTREAVKLINGKYKTESSGGITISNLRDYAECGVDFISVGALTHQIKSLDLSLKAVN